MIPKYRAWDKKEKIMHRVDVIDFGLKKIGVLGNKRLMPLDFEDAELLQMTGRKDMGGIDIYEGDIIQIPYTYYDRIDWAVKVPYEEYILGFVVFDKKRSAFGVIVSEDVDELSKGFNSFDFVFENIGYRCEIIGDRFNDKELVNDIFENHEYLEGAETK